MITRDSQLQTEREVRERIASIERQHERLCSTTPSRYPDVNAKRDQQIRKLNDRVAALRARLAPWNVGNVVTSNHF